jgi:tetratricopeptide (TPR) repeat protein
MTRHLIFIMLLSTFSSAVAQEPAKDAPPPIQDILNNVKKRAAEQKLEDQRRALLFLQRAENSRQAGRFAEALEFARKAQVLFPESADIRLALTTLVAEQRDARELSANMALARNHLTEALNRADGLFKSGRASDALELVEAVRQAADNFPAGFDVQPERAQADKLLASLQHQGATRDGAETIPVPPRVIREMSPSEMRLALAKRVSIEWRDEPLSIAFPIIVQESGVRVVVDPYLEKLGVFEVPRTGLRISNASVERLLRFVTDMAGASYIIQDGEIYITTKANALAQAIARSPDRVDVLPAHRPSDYPRRPMNPDQPPAAEKPPDYLMSGRALREDVRQLLKPPVEKVPAPKEP